MAQSNGSNATGTQGGSPTVSVQQQSVCTPSIGGIQVDGLVTNTIIAGTTGYFSIYGGCLGSATAVLVDGTGIQITSLQYSGDGQVNAFYQAAGNATPGTHNVTVVSLNGTSSTSNSSQVFVVSVTLQSFTFTGSVSYSRDCTGAATLISPPAWPATSGVCPQIGYTGDHAIYAAGQTMQGSAVFTVTPAPQQAVTGIYVQGATSGSGTFTATGITIQAGATTFTASVVSDTPFPASLTQFINPLNVNWSVAQSGTSCTNATYGCVAVGASANPVYVTLAPNVLPPTMQGVLNPVMLTYVALAVGNGGANSQTLALQNTWAKFSSTNCPVGISICPANVVTWDGRSMSYYTAGFNSCALLATQIVQNLPTPSAQCGAFALLLESALAMNGIHSNWETVQATYSSLMVIKNWCLIGMRACPGTPTYQNVNPSVAPWVYKLTLNVGDFMVPTPSSGYGDLTNLQGVAGQGENMNTSPPFTPLEKVFASHFIVQIPTLDGAPTNGNQYYDPSYGVTYPSPAGFEAQAVAGYAAQFAPDVSGSGGYHVFAPIPGTPNISFTYISANSM